jgi:hypothetical protein
MTAKWKLGYTKADVPAAFRQMLKNSHVWEILRFEIFTSREFDASIDFKLNIEPFAGHFTGVD